MFAIGMRMCLYVFVLWMYVLSVYVLMHVYMLRLFVFVAEVDDYDDFCMYVSMRVCLDVCYMCLIYACVYLLCICVCTSITVI